MKLTWDYPVCINFLCLKEGYSPIMVTCSNSVFSLVLIFRENRYITFPVTQVGKPDESTLRTLTEGEVEK